MPRKAQPATDKQLKNAKPQGKEYTISDGNGLALLIKPNGSKLWRFNYYHPQTQKRILVSFGSYPEVTLAQARERREEYRSMVAQGIDPQEKHRTDKQQKAEEIANTFGNIAKQRFEYRKTKKNFSEEHADQTWRAMKLHLFPTFEKMPISQITARTAIEAISYLQEQNKLPTLKKIIQILNQVFTFALHREIVSFNPCLNLSKEFAPQYNHFATIDAKELPQFFARLIKSRIYLSTKQAILWQLLTMSRPNETAKAKWEDIDEASQTWNYYIKKGRKENELGRLHTVTLSSQAMNLLQEIKAVSRDYPYLFPNRHDKSKGMYRSTVNLSFYRIDYNGILTAHGMRSIASTYLNDEGYHSELIEVALSHLDKDRTRKAYNHAKYITRGAEILQIWGDYVEKCYNEALALTQEESEK